MKEVIIRICCKEEEIWTSHPFIVTKDEQFFGFDLEGFCFEVPVSEVISIDYMLSPISKGKECDDDEEKDECSCRS